MFGSRSGVMRENATIPSTMAITTPTSTVIGFLTLNFENIGYNLSFSQYFTENKYTAVQKKFHEFSVKNYT